MLQLMTDLHGKMTPMALMGLRIMPTFLMPKEFVIDAAP
jgi:hypothetical protein